MHRATNFILASIFDVEHILLGKEKNLIGNIINDIGQNFKIEK